MPLLALKIDVDTHEGLRDGVPRLLGALGRRGVRASFYVAMGPDNSGKAVLRVLRQKGFLRKMIRSDAAALYGVRTALSGTLLPAREIARSFPDLLRRVVGEGHELGVHGFDHVYWHDRLLSLDDAAVAAEIDRGLAVHREIVGADPAGFAAPGWQCTAASVRALDRGPFAYQASTRGTRPYRPRAGGVEGRIPELPTTLATLDELLGLGMKSEAAILDAYVAAIGDALPNVHTVHAEVEGGRHLALFERLLDRWLDRVTTARLDAIAASLDLAALPVCEVVQATRPGRAGTVSCQGEPVVDR